MKFRPGTAVVRRTQTHIQIGTDADHHEIIADLPSSDIAALIHGANAALPSYIRPTSSWGRSPRLIPAHLQARLRSTGFAANDPHSERLHLLIDGVTELIPPLIDRLLDEYAVALTIRDSSRVDEGLSRLLGTQQRGTTRTSAIRRYVEERWPHVDLRPSSLPDAAIIIRDRTIGLDETSAYIAQDLPHLMVLRTEFGYEIGPYTVPGVTPCHLCGALHRADADPLAPLVDHWAASWPLLAASSAATSQAASIAAQMLSHYEETQSANGADASAVIIRVDAAGRQTREVVHAHPGCGCGAAGVPFSINEPAAALQ